MQTPEPDQPEPVYPEAHAGPLGDKPAKYAQSRRFMGRNANTQTQVIVVGVTAALVLTALFFVIWIGLRRLLQSLL